MENGSSKRAGETLIRCFKLKVLCQADPSSGVRRAGIDVLTRSLPREWRSHGRTHCYPRVQGERENERVDEQRIV